jgi:hypothetical protein
MNTLVRSLLAVLDAHPLVSHIRIVQLDETPTGRLEVKIRCRIAGQKQFQLWIYPLFWTQLHSGLIDATRSSTV